MIFQQLKNKLKFLNQSQNNKQNQILLPKQDQSEELQLPKFTDSESRVFTELKGKFYIGTEEIQPAVLSILKDQAANFKTSQLYEVIIATLQNEASNLALVQSTKWEDVNYAKALWHVQYVITNMIHKLTK